MPPAGEVSLEESMTLAMPGLENVWEQAMKIVQGMHELSYKE